MAQTLRVLVLHGPNLNLTGFREPELYGKRPLAEIDEGLQTEAEKLGYRGGDLSWCNLGQGQPETGSLPGAPPRIEALPIAEDAYEYAPVAGLRDLRDAVGARRAALRGRVACVQTTALG
jgi:hypothetical protein